MSKITDDMLQLADDLSGDQEIEVWLKKLGVGLLAAVAALDARLDAVAEQARKGEQAYNQWTPLG